MKSLRAHKCKDGWEVRTTDTRHLHSKSDVLKFMKQEGLKFNINFSNEHFLFAE